jgi:hypothetical protein
MDIDLFLKWGTPIGAVVAFLVGLYQWSDARRRDVEQKRFEQFHRAFEWVAGRTANGQSLVDTQQAMAIYELTHFPEYKDISIPILNYYLEKSAGEEDTNLFRQALLHAKAKLESKYA